MSEDRKMPRLPAKQIKLGEQKKYWKKKLDTMGNKTDLYGDF